MNGSTFPEMLQSVNPSGAYGPHLTVLERQRAALHSHHQQQGIYEDFFAPAISGGRPAFCMTSQGLLVADASNNHPLKLDPGVHENWPDFGGFCGGPGLLEPNYGNTLGCHPLASPAPAVEKVDECGTGDQKSGQVGSRKREVDQLTIIKTEDDDDQEKKKKMMRGCTEESKLTVQSYNNDHHRKNNKKGAVNPKDSEVPQKQDYIHVRARRGQATDSHSLAERVRREKISERMKFLQDLVPGCNKIIGKAGMLDEIINYVQSLQRQVEFLSMKLAAVNPSGLDIDIDSLFAKHISPACAPNFSAIEAEGTSNQGYLHFNTGNQVVSCLGMELGVNNPDQGLWRTISAPLPVTEKFLDVPSLAQMQSQSAAAATTWDDDMSLQQSLYSIEFQQARGMAIPSHPFT